MKLLSIAVLALIVSACGGDSDTPTAPSNMPPAGSIPYSATDLRVGTGATATVGRSASVRYAGWLYSTVAAENKGNQFDAGTFSFTVGSGVITGFSQGVTGMQVGGIRRVVIPPSLGYGNQANGSIPANSTLIFEIELLAVQ